MANLREQAAGRLQIELINKLDGRHVTPKSTDHGLAPGRVDGVERPRNPQHYTDSSKWMVVVNPGGGGQLWQVPLSEVMTQAEFDERLRSRGLK